MTSSPAPPGRRPAPRWLALVFPWLPADRLRAARPHLFVHAADTPIALVEARAGRERIAACDRRAAAGGVMPGMTAAEARALVPDLRAFAHDPHADLDRLDALAEACRRYAVTVEAHPPDALLVEVSAGAAAFGGERALVADLEARMARRGVALRHALGDTRAVALALARHAGAPAPDKRGAVRRLPLAALDLDADAFAALAAAGLRTVGELAARPPAEVAARLGRDAVLALRRLTGEAQAADPPAAAPPPRAERLLSPPVAAPGELATTVADLAATLDPRDGGERRWRVRLFRADGPVHLLAVTASDRRTLVAALRAPMRSLVPGAGYDLVQLESIGCDRRASRPLIPPAAAPAPHRPQPPRPRSASRPAASQPELALAMPTAPPATAPAEPDAPPIHLFDPPELIDRVVVADDAPARFRWRRRVHEVLRADGPERVGSPRHPDDPPRDYFRVEDRRGRRLWLFRRPDPAAPDVPPRWYVHGLFA